MKKLILISSLLVGLCGVLRADVTYTYGSDGSYSSTQQIGGVTYSNDNEGNYRSEQTIHTGDTDTNQGYQPSEPSDSSSESYQIKTIGNYDYITGSEGYQGTGQRIGDTYYYDDNK